MRRFVFENEPSCDRCNMVQDSAGPWVRATDAMSAIRELREKIKYVHGIVSAMQADPERLPADATDEDPAEWWWGAFSGSCSQDGATYIEWPDLALALETLKEIVEE